MKNLVRLRRGVGCFTLYKLSYPRALCSHASIAKLAAIRAPMPSPAARPKQVLANSGKPPPAF